jgi:hypothetical protein
MLRLRISFLLKFSVALPSRIPISRWPNGLLLGDATFVYADTTKGLESVDAVKEQGATGHLKIGNWLVARRESNDCLGHKTLMSYAH